MALKCSGIQDPAVEGDFVQFAGPGKSMGSVFAKPFANAQPAGRYDTGRRMVAEQRVEHPLAAAEVGGKNADHGLPFFGPEGGGQVVPVAWDEPEIRLTGQGAGVGLAELPL